MPVASAAAQLALDLRNGTGLHVQLPVDIGRDLYLVLQLANHAGVRACQLVSLDTDFKLGLQFSYDSCTSMMKNSTMSPPKEVLKLIGACRRACELLTLTNLILPSVPLNL